MRIAAVLASLLLAAPALAAETGGCGKFAWPVEADIALITKGQSVESGATLDLSSGSRGVRAALGDVAQAGFEIAPERAPPPQALAGVLRFEAQAGTYQVTLTDAPWIDLVQNGRALKPAGFSGVLDCEGARKSMRFDLSAGPATLQISAAKSRAVGIAITRLP